MANTKEDAEIPRFVELRGCVNCGTYNRFREKYKGKSVPLHDHEAVIGCGLYGCISYGFDYMHPFIDPLELIDFL